MDSTTLRRILIAPADTLRYAMLRINEVGCGIAIVVDEHDRLLFTITDGDLRRAILQSFSLDATADAWAAQHPEQGNRRPTTAAMGTPTPELLELMAREGVHHIPLVDTKQAVVDLAIETELLGGGALDVKALLMAGGEGRRLRPLTVSTPKPMLPVGDRPLMEHIVKSLRTAGIRHVSIATHYKAERIVEHFGDGTKFGVAIDYLNEEAPLGTAGALALATPWTSTLLMLNGDVLTRLNYQSMIAFHRENAACLTVAVRQYDVQVPYGIVETCGVEVQAIKEKPVLEFFVNAGVYLLEPEVRDDLQGGGRLDMPELMGRLLAAGKRVVCFPVSEYWIDVGREGDYSRVQDDIRAGRIGV